MAFCLYDWVRIFLMSLHQARFLYLLFRNDRKWNPETVTWWDLFVPSEDSVRLSARPKVWVPVSVDGCTPETLPWRGAHWLQLWWDLTVELLQEFLHSFGLWRLHPQECEMSTHDVSSVASWPEIAEVLITITFRKLLSVNRLSRNTQITRLYFTSWATLPGKRERRTGNVLRDLDEWDKITSLEKYIKKWNKNSGPKTSGEKTVQTPSLVFADKLKAVGSVLSHFSIAYCSALPVVSLYTGCTLTVGTGLE